MPTSSAAVDAITEVITFVSEHEFESLLLEKPLEVLGDLAVESGRDSVEELDHRHLGAKTRIDRAELKTDDARTDHCQLRRNFLERKRSSR